MTVPALPPRFAIRRLTDAIDLDLVRVEALALLQWAEARECATTSQVYAVVDRERGKVVGAALGVTADAESCDGVEVLEPSPREGHSGSGFALDALLENGERRPLDGVVLPTQA